MTHRTTSNAARQSGLVLITALILLIMMTLLALTAVRMISQQERMAGYSYDRGLAFQAAEAALRSAEAALEAIKPTPTSGACSSFSGSSLTVHVCPIPGTTETRWTDTTFAGWANAATVGSGDLSITPQYFAEYLGNTFPCDPADPSASATTCKRYRITARAGGNGRAAAMLQSVYATD